MQDYSQDAREVIADGYTIMKYADSTIRIMVLGILPRKAWGFNSDAVRRDAERIHWQDKVLANNLAYGFDDYAESTPKLCAALPHQQSTRLDPDALLASIRK